jgi:hypothetical protein
MTRFFFSLSFAGQLLCSSSWGALSDERTGLQFAVQSVSGQSRGGLITIHYCLVWLPFPSPLTTRWDYGGSILTRLHTGTLWREDGSVICSAICQWSESRSTHNQTLLSHLRLLGSLSVASYDSQGLRWKYSCPPPHGDSFIVSHYFIYPTCSYLNSLAPWLPRALPHLHAMTEWMEYMMFQKELYNFETLYKFIPRTCTMFWIVIM